jgi:hypothetical protein
VFDAVPSFDSEKVLSVLDPTGKAGVIVKGNNVPPLGVATFVTLIVAGKITAVAVRARSCEPPPPPLNDTSRV